MEKYILKNWSIGFEVPFFDLSDHTGIEELNANLTENYKSWFDVLRCHLLIFEMPNEIELDSKNTLLLYNLVIRIDTDLINIHTFESDFKELNNKLESTLVDFLNSKKLDFRIIKSE